ncbi:MAG: cytidyltransferase [Cenarchaeum symbiont of Oopsacas minuta]|nr:cytidyltransferase [Cenarchaeum symbiont of Oopsacas minuta]
MKRFKVSATGGTFDILHKGHMAILAKSFELSEDVIIGLCGDRMASRKGKKLLHVYEQRLENLHNALNKNFPDAKYSISHLDDDFGPAMLEDKVDALIASDETSYKGIELNTKRTQKGLKPIEIISVDMVMAYDDKPISSTRIRNNEVDFEGHRA